MKSVLVTGATTPLGVELVRSLLADTRIRHVLAADRHPADGPLPIGPHQRLTYVPVDLRRTRKVRELLFGPARNYNCEVVVHLAEDARGYGAGRSAYAANVEALRSITSLADRHPSIKRLVVRSHAFVYKVSLDLPVRVMEDHPLNMAPSAPQYVRDRVEADLTACARMGLINCEVVVLRMAEVLAPGFGSQLFDYLNAPVVLRTMGFDPMINVASPSDMVRALELATHGSGEGVFNIPGADTLPLAEAARKFGARVLPAPELAIRPLYRFRHLLTGSDFSYGINRNQLHFGLVLDGRRAKDVLNYRPMHPIEWPSP